jgi:hypothetical protein
MVLSALIYSAGCCLFSKFRKMSFLIINSGQDMWAPPAMPTLSIDCEILACRGKHVLMSEESSFPKGHIWNMFRELAWNLWDLWYGFQDSERSDPLGYSRHGWQRELSLGKRERPRLRVWMYIVPQHRRWVTDNVENACVLRIHTILFHLWILIASKT